MTRFRVGVLAGVFVMAAVAVAGAGARPGAVSALKLPDRYMVVMKSGVGASAATSAVTAAGGKVVGSIPEARMLMVVGNGTPGFRQALSANANVEAVARDSVKNLILPEQQALTAKLPVGKTINLGGGAQAFAPPPDPAMSLPGLMWNLDRVGVPGAWNGSYGGGSTDVMVGVADTGLDYTHPDLGINVAGVTDFTTTENPDLCDFYFGASDEFVANVLYGGAVAPDMDFNGHGTWIGGNIAGTLNDMGINGIAPGVSLWALKISGWCGSAYTSTILSAFYYAANNGFDVVSISFGGYSDRTDPDSDLAYRMTQTAVNYARHKGTTIVASAGNDHTRIGAGGRVLSHGVLQGPPGGTDYFGLWQDPGGVPGVIDVSSTGNIVNGSTVGCPADALANGTFSWCKPSTDAHQPIGVGRKDQLAYYSNYGPRIDIAGPGGARKFNLPAQDRGGCEGWPWCGLGSIAGGTSVADGYNAWEDFSTISNWTVNIPCVVIIGADWNGDCYNSIQGTSMATPHVSATLALIATAFPQWRHKPDKLTQWMKLTATRTNATHGNRTPPVSATDTSPMDYSGVSCPGGWCHLGGPAISNAEAYGAGIVNADRAIP